MYARRFFVRVALVESGARTPRTPKASAKRGESKYLSSRSQCEIFKIDAVIVFAGAACFGVRRVRTPLFHEAAILLKAVRGRVALQRLQLSAAGVNIFQADLSVKFSKYMR